MNTPELNDHIARIKRKHYHRQDLSLKYKLVDFPSNLGMVLDKLYETVEAMTVIPREQREEPALQHSMSSISAFTHTTRAPLTSMLSRSASSQSMTTTGTATTHFRARHEPRASMNDLPMAVPSTPTPPPSVTNPLAKPDTAQPGPAGAPIRLLYEPAKSVSPRDAREVWESKGRGPAQPMSLDSPVSGGWSTPSKLSHTMGAQ